MHTALCPTVPRGRRLRRGRIAPRVLFGLLLLGASRNDASGQAPAGIPGVVTGAAVGETAAEAGATRLRLLLLPPGGPAIVELRARLGEQSLAAARREMLAAWLPELAGPQESLAWDVALTDRRLVGSMRSGRGANARWERRQRRQLFDADGDQQVNASELEAFLNSLEPWGVAIDWKVIDEASRRPAPPPAWLDLDGDEAVSPGEAARASQMADRLDQNDDQWLTADELDRVAGEAVRSGDASRANSLPAAAFNLSGQVSWSAVAVACDERYPESAGPSAVAWPQARALWQFLDADGNGLVAHREIPRLAEAPADWSLELALDSEGLQRPAVTSHGVGGDARPLENSATAAWQAAWSRGTWNLAIEVADRGFALNAAKISEQFEQADTNGNGYLEEGELPPWADRWKNYGADADENGQLTRDEYLQAWKPLRHWWLSALQVELRPAADPWQQVLDPNGDQRISLRERWGWSRRLARLQPRADLDTALRAADLASAWRLVVTRGAAAATMAPAMEGAPAGAVPGDWKTGAAGVAPWFAAMDTNGDGDLSRREFLGDDQQWHQFDTDGDQLLDPDEARARRQ